MQRVKKFSPTIYVENPADSCDFYIRHFDAEVKFDCGWYITVAVGGCELCFMKPQSSEQSMFSGNGLMYSFEIENVDSEHSRLLKLGANVVMPLEDHPWGDRAFAILDPNGITLYFYKLIAPAEEFKESHKNL